MFNFNSALHQYEQLISQKVELEHKLSNLRTYYPRAFTAEYYEKKIEDQLKEIAKTTKTVVNMRRGRDPQSWLLPMVRETLKSQNESLRLLYQSLELNRQSDAMRKESRVMLEDALKSINERIVNMRRILSDNSAT